MENPVKEILKILAYCGSTSYILYAKMSSGEENTRKVRK